jgi:xanthine dehydrogenase YagR molybdenum-binding subunit
VSETIDFSLNGEERSVDVRAEEPAVEVLRDRLGLTGTKLVCGEGVCGACTILLDGVAVTSCLLPATGLAGRTVTTVEGFGPGLHPVQRAFVARDGLQCGYCTPGFVVEAIAFYDRWRAERGNEEPRLEDVVSALAGHLCRCGAYLGIIAAVRDACAGRFDAVEDPTGPRVEAPLKVTGRAVYTTDVHHEGQLEGRIVRSSHPHARVLSVDLASALALPGVRAAVELVGEDRIVRYVGQEVAAVAAVDRHTAEQARAMVKVTYEPLPAVIGMEAARAAGAPLVYTSGSEAPSAGEGETAPAPWDGNVRGPVTMLPQETAEAARSLVDGARWAGDPLLVEGRWRTDAQVHTALEPHACVARWEGDELHVHVSTQAVVEVAHRIAKRFGLLEDKVHLVAEHVGGGFGAKLSLTPETVTAVELARAAGAPVRVVLDREEEMSVAGYRPGAEIDVALLASRTGGLPALQMQAYGDGGVATGSMISAFAGMLYPAGAMQLLDYDVVNHMPPGAPFRGPGGPLACWALEQAVDEAAHRLGEDPLSLRRRWDLHPGRRRLYDWVESLPLWKGRPRTGTQSGRYRQGVGVAAGGWLYMHQSNCQVEVGVEGGRLYVATAVQDMGTGSRSVLVATVARAFGVGASQVGVRIGDTRLVTGPTSGGSRTTATLVPAAFDAASRLRGKLAEDAGTRVGLADARAGDEGIRHAGGLVKWREALDRAPDMNVVAARPEDAPTEQPPPMPPSGTLTFGSGFTGAVHVSEVEVDTLLGRTRVLRVAVGIAAGRIAVPELARSQCYGGVIQGIGYALYEQRQVDPRTGLVLSTGLEDYRIPGIGDVPEIDIHFDEEGFEHVPGGGVGLSELSTLAVAASVGNAVHDATGWRPHDLPVRPDRLLEGLSG